MSPKEISRRDFLKDTTAAASALYLSLPDSVFSQQVSKTKVVLIRKKNLLNDKNEANQQIVDQMLDEAVANLLDEKEPLAAWKKLIKPEDVVGIKTNEIGYLPTPPAINRALKLRVLAAGVPEKNIGIKDRGVHSDPLFQKATVLINTRPLRTHHWSGVGSLLKNYIMFVKTPWEYHADSCADLAKLWQLPITKGKTRLNVLVMFTPLFHSVGPHNFNPQYTWNYNGLLVGTDPVAVDAVGLRILLAKRREYFKEESPLPISPKHIFLADTRHHLGTADAEKIELVRLGWQEGNLI